jgi:TATA-box binding protein (TBP) (component of TFIID and TFIIIB)
VITASAVHQLNGRIEPHLLPPHFSYKPELFPAVMFRRERLHFICHLSGKMMNPPPKKLTATIELNYIWKWRYTP